MGLDLLLAYSMQFIGIPYKWGGRHPSSGLDCSGLVRILIVSQGLDIGIDSTAQKLYEQFSQADQGHEVAQGELGALAFYGPHTKGIVHVAMLVSENQMIEAYPGDHTVTTLEAAISRRAFVRISPLRKEELVSLLMPEYPFRAHP